MTHVLVMADDECIRFTCAEVLSRHGFRASSAEGAAFPAQAPDVVLLWESVADSLAATRAAYPGVPVIVCAWDRRREWPGADAVVHLPFNGDRVAKALLDTVRASQASARTASAA
jgi:hypothetical protein